MAKKIINLVDRSIFFTADDFEQKPYKDGYTVDGVDFVWHKESATIKMKTRNQYARISCNTGFEILESESISDVYQIAKDCSLEVVAREKAEALQVKRESVDMVVENRLRTVTIDIGMTYPVARYESVKFDIGVTRHIPVDMKFEDAVTELLEWLGNKLAEKIKEIKESVV